MEKQKGTGLKYIPIEDVNLIPKFLVEQLEPRSWDVERFYKLGNMITANKMNFVGVFADKDHMVQGFMLASMNLLTENIEVHMLSLAEEYRGRGIIKEATGIVKKIKKEIGAKKIEFSTIFPEKFETYGYKKSDLVKMEEG